MNSFGRTLDDGDSDEEVELASPDPARRTNFCVGTPYSAREELPKGSPGCKAGKEVACPLTDS